MMSPLQPEKALIASLPPAASGTSVSEPKTADAFPNPTSSKAIASDHNLTIASQELTNLTDLVKGIKKEISAYSQIEREYIEHLESELTGGAELAKELGNNMWSQITMSQIRRLRFYKKEALDELVRVNTRIAQLESRVERISNEEREAELNLKLYELQMLYGGATAGTHAEYQSARYSSPESGQSGYGSKPDVPEKPAGSRKNGRKASIKAKRAHKDIDGNGRHHDTPLMIEDAGKNDISAKRSEKRSKISQREGSRDVPSKDEVHEQTTPVPVAFSETETEMGNGNELNSSDDVKEDISVDNIIDSIIASEQEQSQPLAMPELDIDESITEGEKKSLWGFNFSFGKRR